MKDSLLKGKLDHLILEVDTSVEDWQEHVQTRHFYQLKTIALWIHSFFHYEKDIKIKGTRVVFLAFSITV